MSQKGICTKTIKKSVSIEPFFVPSLFSQQKINVYWCADSLQTTSDSKSAPFLLPPHSALAQHEWEPQFVQALMSPTNEWGSLLTLRSGCCRDRHRRDIARYCRLSHKPVKPRREMRSNAPVPSLASRSKRRKIPSRLLYRMQTYQESKDSVQRTISRLAVTYLVVAVSRCCLLLSDT